MESETIGKQAIDYYATLERPQNLPAEVEILYPYSEPEVQDIVGAFYRKYYADNRPRTFLIGINPGRLGAGITGIPFTDPINLSEVLGISHPFDMKHELSSKFIYAMMEALGGIEMFFSNFYYTGVSPVGYVRDGRNLNYYDDRELQEQLEAYMYEEMKKQVAFGAQPVAFSLGMGKNIAFLKKFNERHGFFEEIRALPHPRWVMQYRLKRMTEFIALYQKELALFMKDSHK